MNTTSEPPNVRFWIALLSIEDEERRKRLWNGYLGQYLPSSVLDEPSSDATYWPTGWVESLTDGWPQLTDADATFLGNVATQCGGYPDFKGHHYMDFRNRTFHEAVNFSGLTLVSSSFEGATFVDKVDFDETRFFHQAWFTKTTFRKNASFSRSRFAADVHFTGARFTGWTGFTGVHFEGGADFVSAVFEGPVRFDDCQFSERYFTGSMRPPCLTSFVGARFKRDVTFCETRFGTTDPKHDPERRIDFSDAVFEGRTDFRKAIFAGPPGFFGTKLHRDTDFHGVSWLDPRDPDTSYNIRAWEQLELMMSQLEKARDRHRFFRLRMRALRKRRGDGLVRSLSWLFEIVSDYGWGVRRAFTSWLSHWLVAGFIVFVSVPAATRSADSGSLLWAAVVTGFSNAHPFLGLTSEHGYLAPYQSVIEKSASTATLQVVGTMQAVVGPVLLFLLLLTIRNRFRLA